MEGWVNPQPGWVRSGYWTWDLLHDSLLLYHLSYPGHLNQTNIPTHLGQPNSLIHISTGSEHVHRTPLNPYKAQHFSSPSDLMKSSCWLDESLSPTTNQCSVPENLPTTCFSKWTPTPSVVHAFTFVCIRFPAVSQSLSKLSRNLPTPLKPQGFCKAPEDTKPSKPPISVGKMCIYTCG